MAVPLRGSEAVSCDRERLVIAVVGAQQLAVPHVGKPQPLVVPGEDPVAIRGRDQLEGSPETILGVVDRALRNRQRERRASIARGLDNGPRMDQRLACLVDSTRRDEVVDQACQVPCTEGVGDTREGKGTPSCGHSDLRRDRKHAGDAEADLGLLLGRKRLP